MRAAIRKLLVRRLLMDELEMIRDFVADTPGPSVRSREAARGALRAEILAGSAHGKRMPTLNWKRLLPTVSAAVILAAGSLLIIGPLLGGGHQTPAVAAVLRAASQAAARQPAHVLQPGQYAYTRSEGAYFDELTNGIRTWGALVRTRREIWIGPDGSGRIRQVSEPPVFLAPGDRARWEEAGAPALTDLSRGQTYDQHFGPGGLATPLNIDGFNEQELLKLENDPDALRRAIQAGAEKTDNPVGYEMLTIVADLLGETAAPPRLRSSLYQAAVGIPDIKLVGTVSDHAGRRGTAIAASRGTSQLELVFDPNTSALLAREETLLRQIPDTTAPAGTAISYTLYLDSAITRSTATG
jgi:hypothetical protein